MDSLGLREQSKWLAGSFLQSGLRVAVKLLTAVPPVSDQPLSGGGGNGNQCSSHSMGHQLLEVSTTALTMPLLPSSSLAQQHNIPCGCEDGPRTFWDGQGESQWCTHACLYSACSGTVHSYMCICVLNAQKFCLMMLSVMPSYNWILYFLFQPTFLSCNQPILYVPLLC